MIMRQGHAGHLCLFYKLKASQKNMDSYKNTCKNKTAV